MCVCVPHVCFCGGYNMMQGFPSYLFTVVWTHRLCFYFCMMKTAWADSHFSVQKCQLSLAPVLAEMTTALWNIAMIELVTPCQCLVVSIPSMWLAWGTERHRYLRHRTLHAAAQLIKTLTFNKTPHYHNGKTWSWRKTLGLVCTLSHPAFLHAFSTGCGSGIFPDANHAACMRACVYVCMNVCVRVFSVAHGSCRLFSPCCILLRISLFSKQKPTTASKQTALIADAAHTHN